VYHTTSCNTQSSVPEDEQNNCPKQVGLNGIINKPDRQGTYNVTVRRVRANIVTVEKQYILHNLFVYL